MKGKWQWLIDNNNHNNSRAKCVIRFLQHLRCGHIHRPQCESIWNISFPLLSIRRTPEKRDACENTQWIFLDMRACGGGGGGGVCVASWLLGLVYCPRDSIKLKCLHRVAFVKFITANEITPPWPTTTTAKTAMISSIRKTDSINVFISFRFSFLFFLSIWLLFLSSFHKLIN